MDKKDAAIIKALEELGLRKDVEPSDLPPELEDLKNQLDNYESEIGDLDPKTLEKYITR